MCFPIGHDPRPVFVQSSRVGCEALLSRALFAGAAVLLAVPPAAHAEARLFDTSITFDACRFMPKRNPANSMRAYVIVPQS